MRFALNIGFIAAASIILVCGWPGSVAADPPEHPAPEGLLRARDLDRGQRQQEKVEAQLKLAQLLEAKDDLQGALAVWLDLLANEPQRASYLAPATRLALDLQRTPQALALARRLVLRAAEVPLHRVLLARALLAAGRPAEAIGHLRWLARRGSLAPQVRRELAQALEATGDARGALGHYRWLVARGHGTLDDRLGLARQLAQLRQPARQLAQLRRLLPLVRGSAQETEVRQELLDCLETLGRNSAALIQVDWLLVRAPAAVPLRLTRMRLLGALKQRPALQAEVQAMAQLGAAVMLQPRVRLGLALAHEDLGQPRAALAQYDWLIARHPRRVDYGLGRAGALGELDRTGAQLAELIRLLRLAPGDIRVHRALAELYYHQERFPLAQRHFATALRLRPGDLHSLRRMAQIKRRQGATRRRLRRAELARERYLDWQLDSQERAEDL